MASASTVHMVPPNCLQAARISFERDCRLSSLEQYVRFQAQMLVEQERNVTHLASALSSVQQSLAFQTNLHASQEILWRKVCESKDQRIAHLEAQLEEFKRSSHSTSNTILYSPAMCYDRSGNKRNNNKRKRKHDDSDDDSPRVSAGKIRGGDSSHGNDDDPPLTLVDVLRHLPAPDVRAHLWAHMDVPTRHAFMATCKAFRQLAVRDLVTKAAYPSSTNLCQQDLFVEVEQCKPVLPKGASFNALKQLEWNGRLTAFDAVRLASMLESVPKLVFNHTGSFTDSMVPVLQRATHITDLSVRYMGTPGRGFGDALGQLRNLTTLKLELSSYDSGDRVALALRELRALTTLQVTLLTTPMNATAVDESLGFLQQLRELSLEYKYGYKHARAARTLITSLSILRDLRVLALRGTTLLREDLPTFAGALLPVLRRLESFTAINLFPARGMGANDCDMLAAALGELTSARSVYVKQQGVEPLHAVKVCHAFSRLKHLENLRLEQWDVAEGSPAVPGVDTDDDDEAEPPNENNNNNHNLIHNNPNNNAHHSSPENSRAKQAPPSTGDCLANSLAQCTRLTNVSFDGCMMEDNMPAAAWAQALGAVKGIQSFHMSYFDRQDDAVTLLGGVPDVYELELASCCVDVIAAVLHSLPSACPGLRKLAVRSFHDTPAIDAALVERFLSSMPLLTDLIVRPINYENPTVGPMCATSELCKSLGVRLTVEQWSFSI
jgi:hypothetical protein